MDDLDALLADLQSTTSHLGGNQSAHLYHHPYSPVEHNRVSSPVNNTEVRKYYTDDNQIPRNMREVTTVTTTTYKTSSGPSPTLNSNLSELDSLLDDLNTSKYQGPNDRKVPTSPKSPRSPRSPKSPNLNGAYRYKSASPTGSTGSGSGFHEMRPSVESLLDELQSAVPSNGRNPDRHTTSTTVTVRSQQPVHYNYTTPSASSATQELDDLMASLSDFKVNPGQSPNAVNHSPDSLYAKPNKPKVQSAPSSGQPRNNHLDSMLGTLQSDMSRQGINTAQKGCCAACSKPIVGQVVTALAKTWHPEHFTCAHCHQELGTKNFFERDGQPYCEPDYHNLFSPRCAYCNGPILDKCVSALDKSWHPEHFFCAQCGNQFGEDGFHEKDGKPYCKEDYFEMFAPKCGGCSRPIMENYISALNTQWHPECFVCRDCKAALQGGSFYNVEGKPVCAKCSGVDEDAEDDDEEEEEEA